MPPKTPRPQPEWVIPVDDGYDPVRITIRTENVMPPCVHVDLRMEGRLLTPLESTQLGMALQDAGRVAGQLGAALGFKRKRRA